MMNRLKSLDNKATVQNTQPLENAADEYSIVNTLKNSAGDVYRFLSGNNTHIDLVALVKKAEAENGCGLTETKPSDCGEPLHAVYDTDENYCHKSTQDNFLVSHCGHKNNSTMLATDNCIKQVAANNIECSWNEQIKHFAADHQAVFGVGLSAMALFLISFCWITRWRTSSAAEIERSQAEFERSQLAGNSSSWFSSITSRLSFFDNKKRAVKNSALKTSLLSEDESTELGNMSGWNNNVTRSEPDFLTSTESKEQDESSASYVPFSDNDSRLTRPGQ